MVPMGLDGEKLLLQLNRLEEYLKSINELAKKKKSSVRRRALERLVQIAVEETLNIGNHLISGKGWERPNNYREIFQVLEKEKVISKDLSEELQHFAVFRNRIVHLYWKISDEEFEQQLQRIHILIKFAKVVEKINAGNK